MDIWTNDQLYQDMLRIVPQEFRSISIQWNDKLFEDYIKHPEYDDVWNWDPNVRYTGNWYELLEGVSQLNQRFYVPLVHGSYDEFKRSTYDAVEKTAREHGYKPIWGEQSWDKQKQKPIGPKPLKPIEEDDFN
ncbi:uncharacterized protein CLAFUR5_06643 [Fulvia fulva]|uniref:Uncharacterized protein n=1 Tax=Passalora fulva TaxID=5499 RepID=A0A9Q8UQP3_PASFU|nr:uncharacterized protein CLAFUR5_06643 [Fulvia fulva]KAK4621361.1 hypothetical protein CLAFUR4_06502 [Fulvia fulva]UJO18969.1 hypothetical protein CLAFUR5_06643 [Fulvia fulva]